MGIFLATMIFIKPIARGCNQWALGDQNRRLGAAVICD
jgi:hypothetical protein